MQLSTFGHRMSRPTGLRGIMEDIAATVAQPKQPSMVDSTCTAERTRKMLNLSIGNPAEIPQVVSEWRRIVEHVTRDTLEQALFSYGPSRGDHGLTQAIVRYFRDKFGWPISTRNVVVGPGSQFLCFAAASLFVGPGQDGLDRPLVAPILPDYTGYAGICANSRALVGLPTKIAQRSRREFEYAMDLDALDAVDAAGLFIVSNPSNPAGRAIQSNEFSRLLARAIDLKSTILLDHAYGQPFPRIGPTNVLPVWHPNVLNCFSLSKAGMPGARVAFAVGTETTIDAITSFVSNSCLHANQTAQKIFERALVTGAIDQLSQTAIATYYRESTRFCIDTMTESFPVFVNWKYHATSGGMFLWLWIDEPWFDDLEFYERMKQAGVFVTPGRHFFLGQQTPADHMRQCVRISLSSERSVLRQGLARIGTMLGSMGRDNS